MSTDLAIAVPYTARADAVPGIRITDIIVGDRARKDYGDLTPLMDSIRDVGLLQPIGVLPGNRLLFGGRRLEACRRLGWKSIASVRPSTRDDALSLLEAERDENTCRLDMTPEELVNVGLRMEEMERPNADARQLEGQERGRAARWDGSTSCDVEPSDSPNVAVIKNPTAHKVGAALGLSSTIYQRAKHVVQVACGDIEAPDDVREIAKQALTEMNTTGTITGAYMKVRKAQKAALAPEATSRGPAKSPAKSPRPEVLHRMHHVKARRIIAATVDTAAANRLDSDLLAEIDLDELEAHDLVEWISSLSESLKALRSLKTTLERKLNRV